MRINDCSTDVCSSDLSKRVNIHGDKGVVKAVFGWPAIHTRSGEKEEAPTLKNIFLDCGCTSKEEVEELGIHVGYVVTYEDEFMMQIGRAKCRERVGQYVEMWGDAVE